MSSLITKFISKMILPDSSILKYPVSLNEVIKHVKLDVDASVNYSSYIENLIIPTAIRVVENYLETDVAKKWNTLSIYDFSNSEVKVNEGSLIEVQSIVDDTSTVISIKRTEKHISYFKTILDNYITTDPLTITYTSGFAKADIPPNYKWMILIKIADAYDAERGSWNYNALKFDDTIMDRFIGRDRKIYL